jgi:alkylation response protein AidB-like acyl-CoA dehydrogenase
MDVALSSDERAFRDELCAFLDRELSDETRRANHDPGESDGWSAGYTRHFRRRLGESGYIGMTWPTEYGGQGRGMNFGVLFAEEMEYHRAPALDSSITYVPQAILAFGSDDLKRQFLPRLSRGENAFFLGYSEPEAGSDLASLSTRAVDEGDHFVITGQKAYSSRARSADFGWVAARTDPQAAKHRGISVFIIDMTSPGISITTQRTVGGWDHPSVYFDSVEVPRTRLVGQLNGGWQVIMGAIDFERATLGAPGLVCSQLDRLLEFCCQPQESGGAPIDDPLVLDRLAGLAIEVEATRLISYWVASLHEAGLRPQHETSLATLYKRETARRLDAEGVELLGGFAPLRPGSPYARLDGEVEHDYFNQIYFQFAAGGFDITRNVIASRGLGLPR